MSDLTIKQLVDYLRQEMPDPSIGYIINGTDDFLKEQEQRLPWKLPSELLELQRACHDVTLYLDLSGMRDFLMPLDDAVDYYFELSKLGRINTFPVFRDAGGGVVALFVRKESSSPWPVLLDFGQGIPIVAAENLTDYLLWNYEAYKAGCVIRLGNGEWEIDSEKLESVSLKTGIPGEFGKELDVPFSEWLVT